LTIMETSLWIWGFYYRILYILIPCQIKFILICK
jgi:hypothetical protein